MFFYLLLHKTMKNHDTVTIRDINNILKKSDFYFIIEKFFWKDQKFRIKKIEYDRKTPHNQEWTRRENRGNFYLIYDCEDVEHISEGILYDTDKQGGLRFIYRELERMLEEWKKILYTSNRKRATEGTAYDF